MLFLCVAFVLCCSFALLARHDDLVEKLPHLSIRERQCHYNWQCNREKTTVHFCFSIQFVSGDSNPIDLMMPFSFLKCTKKALKFSSILLRMLIYCLIFYHGFIERNANVNARAAVAAECVAKLRCCEWPLNAMSLVSKLNAAGGFLLFHNKVNLIL